MKLNTFYGGVELHREDKIVYAKFLAPHRVLSTCRAAGGLRDDLAALYNHQMCEPAGASLSDEMFKLIVEQPGQYRELIAGRYDLPADKCATFSTAAHMNSLVVRRAAYEGLEVTAALTAGISSNASRAGDPAAYVEEAGEFKPLAQIKSASPVGGTIVTMLFINQELEPGAMVTAVMTATEAKCALLQELGVGSGYSDGLATGTGTDQIGIVSQMGDAAPLSDAGKHSKLGELIATVVRDALTQALAEHNSLAPLTMRSVVRHIQRFGASRESIITGVGAFLSTEQADLFAANFLSVDRHPLIVAGVAALAHLRDELVFGILPGGCLPEIMAGQGAQLAAAVSGKWERLPAYRTALAEGDFSLDNADFLRLIYRALALGFAEKWM